MAGTAPALALLILAGLANAAFALPMKYVRRWEWENTWALWSLFALVFLPLIAAFGCVPSLPVVFRAHGFATAVIVSLLGAGWGLAQVLFGKAIHAIGIGLTFSIVLGLSAAAGSVLPILQMRPGTMRSDVMVRILAGLVLVLLGVTACAEAGRRREREQANIALRSGSFIPGLIMALCSGALASFMNFGLSFGSPLAAEAAARGASEPSSVFSIWLPLLLGGAVPNLLYCAYLMSSRHTWGLFRGTPSSRNVYLTCAMALLWFFSTALYGVASHALGAWGAVLAWPVFMSVIVIGAGLIGVATGEWRYSGRTPILFQVGGILLLVFAIVAFSRSQDPLIHSREDTPIAVPTSAAIISPGGNYVR